jgi:protein-S-isoprenylcysteine O-methyltransferase Ste14
MATDQPFYESVLSFSGVLLGFVVLMVSWRIGREAEFDQPPIRHIPIGMSLGAAAALLLIFLCILPSLIFLRTGSAWSPSLSAGALLSALVCVIGHIVTDAAHYDLFVKREDREEHSYAADGLVSYKKHTVISTLSFFFLAGITLVAGWLWI